ncbi:hypothetical protein [[Mycoplasma] anseris]|uniref:hypothetical protein n=1 Tax=[Mycoplasma] anseris TaxID=92400 RepID=UPI000A8DB7AF|nr:hypothetical protein [[Mycoplasma] anseris]
MGISISIVWGLFLTILFNAKVISYNNKIYNDLIKKQFISYEFIDKKNFHKEECNNE